MLARQNGHTEGRCGLTATKAPAVAAAAAAADEVVDSCRSERSAVRRCTSKDAGPSGRASRACSQCRAALDAPEHDAPRGGSGPGRPRMAASPLLSVRACVVGVVVPTEKRSHHHLVAMLSLCIRELIAPSSPSACGLQCPAKRPDPPHASSRLHAPRRGRFVEPAHTFDST